MNKRNSGLHDTLRQSVMDDPESRAEYEAFKLQLEPADERKPTREKAASTPANVTESHL